MILLVEGRGWRVEDVTYPFLQGIRHLPISLHLCFCLRIFILCVRPNRDVLFHEIFRVLFPDQIDTAGICLRLATQRSTMTKKRLCLAILFREARVSPLGAQSNVHQPNLVGICSKHIAQFARKMCPEMHVSMLV